MAVHTVLQELSDVLPDYELIRDCVAGQRAVKAKTTKYLPDPDESEPDPKVRQARYKSYLMRAVFYGVTGRTLRGLVGLVFEKDPAVAIPANLEIMRADVSGAGTPLDQHAETTLDRVVSLGRAGLLTDYPRREGQPTTVAEAEAGNIRPTINRYEAENIINWRTKTVGAKVMKSLVVLKERVIVADDGFTQTMGDQYRVLKLDDATGNYMVELWRDVDSDGFTSREQYTPLDGAGKPFKEIPFEFVGSEDNEPSVDRPPLLDIAELNKAHYLNSADYEESVFMLGQPTPVFAGLTKQWVDDVFTYESDDGHGNKRKISAVRLGSRQAVSLPQGGSAELLQVEPNTLAKDAMEHKEAQMVALGAKLIENTGTQQTATEATQDFVMDNSVLGTCARNVSMAYRRCLGWAHQFVTGTFLDNADVLDYTLNTDFAARTLTAADRQQIVQAWKDRAITFEEMRWGLKRAGSAYLEDDEAREQLAAERETDIEFEATAAEALAKAQGGAGAGAGDE